MKKILLFASALAGLFLAASCQQENLEPVGGNTVTYTVQVPDALATKALGDDITNINVLHYEVYRTEVANADVFTTADNLLYHKTAPMNNGTATISLELVNDQNYTVLFWAQAGEANEAYDVTDLTNVTVKSSLKANQESYAAFTGVDFIVDGKNLAGRTVTLERPIAQINIATTPESLNGNGAFVDAVVLEGSSVTVAGLSNSFNVAKQAPGAEMTTTYEFAEQAVPTVTLEVNGKNYTYVAMNYVGFADEVGNNVKVSYVINTSEGDIDNDIENVPVKPNYRTNIVGNLITATSDYTVTLDAEWASEETDVEIITDGLVLVHSTGVYNISNANGLAYASQNLFANGGSYVLTADIDMSEYTALETKAGDKFWKSATISHKTFAFDGKGHSISNLPGMFVSYTIYGDLTIKNLTLNNPNIAYDIEDKTSGGAGVGAFFGFSDAFNKILLENCHIKGGKIEGGHWTGGLIGFASGWEEASALTIKNCSVKETTVTGKGSCGGIIGHANGGKGLVEMNTISVFSNTIKSTGTDTNKAGSVMGTVGSASVKVTNCSAIDNEVTSNDVDNTKLWGRQGSTTGVLYVDGVLVEDFGTFTPSPTVTVTNDAELAKAVEVLDVKVIKLAAGTYSENIVLTVAEEGAFQRDIKFEAVEGASPVIAGTVTLGYRNQGVAAAMWNGNITFEGITFDHANPATHSLDVQDVKSLTLKNCTIIGDGEYGLDSSRGNATGPSLIDNCTFENAAMQILGNFGTGLVINECTFNESRINVQAGNGVTVQNCNFTNTLTSANVNDSFYLIRSNSTPITVKGCNINIDSELTDVAANEINWAILHNRGTKTWEVENVSITMSEAALDQTELFVTKCTLKDGTPSGGTINTTNLTVNGKAYASTAASLTSAVNSGATDIYVEGNFKMPSSGTSNAITITSLNGNATIDNTLGSYWDGATLTFNNVNFKTGTGYANGNGSDYAALYSKNVTYNKCNFSGPMRLGRDGAKFIDCTFNDLGNDYVWTYGNAASFTGCTFNSAGKALLIFSDGGNGAPAVSVTGCTFNATTGAKAGAISNQNCAAIEIHNYGYGVTLTTADNTVDTADGKFSGEWRIKTYETRNADSKIFVNGTEYTTLALDGRTMTIDGTVVTVQ